MNSLNAMVFVVTVFGLPLLGLLIVDVLLIALAIQAFMEAADADH